MIVVWVTNFKVSVSRYVIPDYEDLIEQLSFLLWLLLVTYLEPFVCCFSYCYNYVRAGEFLLGDWSCKSF